MGWVSTVGTLIRSEQTDYKKVKCNFVLFSYVKKIFRLFGCKKNTLSARPRRGEQAVVAPYHYTS